MLESDSGVDAAERTRRIEIHSCVKSDAESLNHLKLPARHDLAHQARHVDGQCAGIGFEARETRAEPPVSLKKNLVIYAIGCGQELTLHKVAVAAALPPPGKE
jgi:hypothetical protein